ncbi:hypothetical protein QP760_08350 [Corynebacterium coyleae]|nr:hypothetical protein [Corynebacterium coyleae]
MRFTPQMYSSEALRPESHGLSSVSRMMIRSISPSRSTVTEFGSTTTGFGVDEDTEDAVDAAEDAVDGSAEAVSAASTFFEATALSTVVAVEATGSCASTG